MAKRFRVCTVCRGRALNCLCRVGVPVRRVRSVGRTLTFCVPEAWAQKAARTLDGQCFDYSMCEMGLRALLVALRKRTVLWITALVCCLAMVAASNVVWTVRVDCPDGLSASVYEALSESGALSPKFRNTVDLDALRRRLTAIDGVALVSVSVRGVYLQVDVKEELPKGIVATSDGAIVASCDCVVSRVVVERGRAMVKEGDSVRRGDVLIAPEYLVDPEADVTVPTQAVGTVYGYTYPTFTYQYDQHALRTVRTGECVRSATVSILGRTYGEVAPNPYAQCETQVEHFSLGAFVPIEVERTTYWETCTEATFAPFAVAKEDVVEYCFSQIQSQLKKEVQISRRWCIIDNRGSIYRVRAYAEVEQTVSIYADEA